MDKDALLDLIDYKDLLEQDEAVLLRKLDGAFLEGRKAESLRQISMLFGKMRERNGIILNLVEDYIIKIRK